MAGRGSRFAVEGYNLPKPLIPVNGIPMIRWVIDNLRPQRAHRFTFICLQAHLDEFPLAYHLRKWAPGCEVIATDGITEGPACSVLLARKQINDSLPLMIANCDQYIDADIDDYLCEMDRKSLDGLIMTMTAHDKKWSFVGFDDAGKVNRVVEKEVISDTATVGIYNFRHGSAFVAAADAMMAANLRVNNEFYVAPTYNVMIERGATVGTYSIGGVGHGMYGLGVPSDLKDFLAHPVSQRPRKQVA